MLGGLRSLYRLIWPGYCYGDRAYPIRRVYASWRRGRSALTKGARRRMTGRVLPPEELAKPIVELLTDTPLVADERELGRFVRLPLCEQFAVAVLVKAGEAETVQDAVVSMDEREEATRERWSGGRRSR